VPVEFLSEEQVARFGRFVADPSPLELERFFHLDDEALKLLASTRREENRMEFAVQWGTVRMLGTSLDEHPTAVPRGVAVFVGEQLGIQAPESLTAYAEERPKTAYEHQWEIRREYGYRESASGVLELREFLAAWMWALEEGPRALLDRAVLWLIEQRVLLPGITVLARLVADVRAGEYERIHGLLAEAPTAGKLEGFERLLRVPKDVRTWCLISCGREGEHLGSGFPGGA
jgi:hypothetical protein